MSELNIESRYRSVLKAMTWRVIATFTTFALAYMIFRDTPNALEKSGIVAGLEMISKLLFYYLHERAWQRVPRGRIRQLFNLKSISKGEK